MEINVKIDDELIAEALRRSGLKNTQEAVKEGLRLLIAVRRQGGIRALRGKVHWQDDSPSHSAAPSDSR